jgi:hypothetical protein
MQFTAITRAIARNRLTRMHERLVSLIAFRMLLLLAEGSTMTSARRRLAAALSTQYDG